MSERFAALLATGYGAPLLLVAKATIVLAVAWVMATLLPARRSAARHLVWTLAVGALLVLPLALLGVPRLPLAVLPAAGAAVDVAGNGAPVSEPKGGVAEFSTSVRAAGETAPAASPGVVLPSTPALSALWLLWGAGAAAVLAWLLVGRVLLALVRRRALPLRGAGWDEPYRDAAWLLGTAPAARLYRSGSATMPVTWGVFRPVVLLPEDAETWPEERRRVVLLHELSHVVRRDCLTQLAAGLACALYWFHPGVWYAARRMRVERERACDDLVLAAGTPAPDYAAHLLELARRFRAGFPTPMVALHMARPSQLEGRLLTVLAGGSGRRPPSRAVVAIAACAVLGLTLPLAGLQPVAGAAAEQAAGPTPYAAPAPHAGPDDDAAVPLAEPADGAAVPLAASGGDDAAEPLAASGNDDAAAPLRVPPVRSAQPEQAATGVRIASIASDSVARNIRRVSPRSARSAITTRDGHSVLLLRDTTLVLQLTDRGLDHVGRTDANRNDGQGLLSSLLGGMLRGGLRVLLDHAIEYSLSDVREARYEDGRLVIESVRGTDVFDDVNINGGAIMAGFDARDARAFAARVNAARAWLR